MNTDGKVVQVDMHEAKSRLSFDRMLVAQARLALVTADEAIRAYDVEIVDPTR